jgi:hypothetical protein
MKHSNAVKSSVRIRGNVVSDATGEGLSSVCIEVLGGQQEEIKKIHTRAYGLFLFELDNSKSYTLHIEHSGYFTEELTVPSGLRSIYFPVLLKSKT